MEASTFNCSICGEGSRDICLFCTKDACSNHLCERCRLCSDCCACDMPVFNPSVDGSAANWHQYGAFSAPPSGPAEDSETPDPAHPSERFE